MPRGWPVRSGRFVEVPEIDRVAWFEPAAARARIKASQVVFIDRLVAHLVAALAIYAFMFWVALSLLYPQCAQSRHPAFGRAAALCTLIAVTVVSGGFVAGLDAGHIFNTFPRMGQHWLPPGAFALAPAGLSSCAVALVSCGSIGWSLISLRENQATPKERPLRS